MLTTDLLATTTLDPEAVTAERAALVAYLAAALDDIEVRRGAVHDLAVRTLAVGAAALRSGIETEVRRRSLVEILADPTLATPEALATALGNFRIVLRGAARAVGTATLTVDAPVPLSLPAGTLFQAGSVLVRTPSLTVARADATLVSGPEEQALRAVGGGLYTLQVALEAVEPGPVGRLRDGQALEPSTPIAHLVSARVAGDFIGGAAAEAPEEALSRLRAGIATRAWSNRPAIEALVRADSRFADLRTLSVIGAGDPEQLRARRNFLGVPQPGRCDVFVRTADSPTVLLVPVTALRVATTAAGDLWQTDLPRNAAPGFYEVLGVSDPDAGPDALPLELTTITRGWDAAALGDGDPDLASASEAAFGAWSTAIVRFTDPAPVAGMAPSRSVFLRVSALPAIAELQAFLGGRAVRPPGGDVHVRACVPATVSLALRARGLVGTAALTSAARAAAAAAMTAQGASGSLTTAPCAAAAQAILGSTAQITRVDLLVRILRSDGTVWVRHGTDEITLPDEPDRGCTRRTLAVFCDPDAVTLSILPQPEP